MSIYNKVSELEWYLCQKALLKEFLSKNAYEKYLSDLDRFHAEWEGLHEPKIVETENKSALAFTAQSMQCLFFPQVQN